MASPPQSHPKFYKGIMIDHPCHNITFSHARQIDPADGEMHNEAKSKWCFCCPRLAIGFLLKLDQKGTN